MVGPRDVGEGKEEDGEADSDEDEEEGDGLQELVGYLEDAPDERGRRLLTRRFHPCKAGGKPAWLVPANLPDPDSELNCMKCGSGLRFLLQVYASQDELERAFHRSISLFVCLNCQPNEVRAFRAQLPQKTPWYGPKKPDADAEKAAAGATPDPELKALCCPRCGLPCRNPSGGCEDCRRRLKYGDPAAVFDEREISVDGAYDPDEDEDDDEEGPLAEEVDEAAAEEADEEQRWREQTYGDGMPATVQGPWNKDNQSEMEKLHEYNKKVKASPEAKLARSEQRVYSEWCGEKNTKDEHFRKFQLFADANAAHVLRYELGGAPLWFCQAGMLEGEPPACERCGARRAFEFQVQPQLIALLTGSTCAERLEYGTICVYTCEAHCDPPAGADGRASYAEEFAFTQGEPDEEWCQGPKPNAAR